MLDYIHGKGVGAMNAWSMADALKPAVDASYNPSEVASHADSRDVYLLESWAFNSDAFQPAPYDVLRREDARRRGTHLADQLRRADVCGEHPAAHRRRSGDHRRISRHGGSPGAHLAARRLRRRRLAYVSSGTDIGLVKPCKPLIGAMPDRRLTAPYTLNGALTEVQAADLGITVHYEPGDYLWTIV